ncbi:hypothetical protein J2Z44_004047 [Clostridium punense]|uniref:Uncharacterized protein n=1 Tax=Clostridium punense TaxID=1054297 RepID=A0ABS4K8S8_9CLOT|nr:MULTISPECIES: hypothetical protein [Clostridium]EQB87688.1 hypothetical protein M918_07920 [Clostridium sp. BL8]MBP2024192.1 hypothetical protein [Clostridium punense]
MIALNKITPFNGFYENPILGQQNNYAWSMSELGDYIYVGTGRNIVFSVAVGVFNIPPERVPKAFIPTLPPDMNAEIWRYNKNGMEPWQRVFKSTPQNFSNGFRFMINYTLRDGREILVAAGGNFSGLNILVSENGTDWLQANNGLSAGNTVRSMIVHNGKLYMGVMIGLGGTTETILYETENPLNGWTRVTFGSSPNNPRGEIASMESFNGHLYLGTSLPGGFEVWRTLGYEPIADQWKLVVDKGAGDAYNEHALSMKTFRGQLYVGTGIWFGIYSIASTPSNLRLIPPKGFDLIRICKNDRWEVIVGSTPLSPTNPVTNGIRNPKIPAGFGFISNAYCWQLEEYDGKLYCGTWDWSVLIPTIIASIINNIDDIIGLLRNNSSLLETILPNNITLPSLDEENLGNLLPIIKAILKFIITSLPTMGGDLWVSENGESWLPISLNGLCNPKNYGMRKLFSADDGRLYVGTANPYQGCEVWRSQPQGSCYRPRC